MAALDQILADQKYQGPVRNAIGCNIKWKPGNEPDYFK
jgi:hypothetical protein